MAHRCSQVSEITLVIGRNLTDHPNASDSLEGVQRRWFGEGALEAVGRAVQQALDRPVKAGMVVKKLLSDGPAVYAGSPAPSDQRRIGLLRPG